MRVITRAVHNNAWNRILTTLITARNTKHADARAISSPLTFADHLTIDISTHTPLTRLGRIS